MFLCVPHDQPPYGWKLKTMRYLLTNHIVCEKIEYEFVKKRKRTTRGRPFTLSISLCYVLCLVQHQTVLDVVLEYIPSVC